MLASSALSRSRQDCYLCDNITIIFLSVYIYIRRRLPVVYRCDILCTRPVNDNNNYNNINVSITITVTWEIKRFRSAWRLWCTIVIFSSYNKIIAMPPRQSLQRQHCISIFYYFNRPWSTTTATAFFSRWNRPKSRKTA